MTSCPCHNPAAFGHLRDACPQTGVPAGGYCYSSGWDAGGGFRSFMLPLRFEDAPAPEPAPERSAA